MKLGVHVSVAGGIDKAVDRAVDFGCNAFQIFISNPRGWRPTILSEETMALFNQKCQEAKIEDIVAHSIYLINLASPNADLREQSIDSLVGGLISAGKLNLLGLVTHIGSHQGDGIEIGTARVVESLNRVLAECDSKGADLLLENTAGAGNLVGKTFTEIGNIIRGVDCKKVGICLDTAHAFESGYKINTEEGLEEMLSEIEREIGLEKLKVIHLNDSMTPLGSNRDRHENYGQGEIGEAGLDRIINHPKLCNIPFVMETPEVKEGLTGRELVDHVRARQVM